MGRLRDFASIVAFLSDREIDEMQAAIDARRKARAEESEFIETNEGPAKPAPSLRRS